MASRDDLFNQAKQKRKEQKVEEESRGNFTFEELAYAPLIENSHRVFRVLGNPLAMRQLPTDPKVIEQSMMLGDDQKRFRCTWPTKEENENWILRKIYNLILDGTWEKPNPDAKAVKLFKYEKKCPSLFNRVRYNDNLDNPYESGWRPGRAVLMNGIDRHDQEYHDENNHAKLLSKKVSHNNDRTYYERGVPQTLYNLIWDNIVEYEGDWENYDVVIKKLTDQPYYQAFYGGSDDLRKRLTQDQPEILDLIKVGPLSAAEKEYELYDLDKIAPVTSYDRIFKKLGSFIKQVDDYFKTTATKTHFYDELVALKEQEAADKKAKAEEETQNEVSQETYSTPKDEPKETPVESEASVETQKETPTRKARGGAKPAEEPSEGLTEEDWAGLADGSFNGKVYKGIAQMTDDEKAQVVSVNADGSFKYLPSWEGKTLELFEEEDSKFESPGTFHVCPFTGVIFK